MTTNEVTKKIHARQYEITQKFLAELEKHLDDILNGRETEMFEIRDFAAKMNIHPRHLTNTVKHVTGKSPCDFFEERLMQISRRMLEETELSISQIAFNLTFDPSNFTKFFKRFAGVTPKQYREKHLLEKFAAKN